MQIAVIKAPTRRAAVRIEQESVCATQGEPLTTAGCCPYAGVTGTWAPSPLPSPVHTQGPWAARLRPLKATCCRQGAALGAALSHCALGRIPAQCRSWLR